MGDAARPLRAAHGSKRPTGESARFARQCARHKHTSTGARSRAPVFDHGPSPRERRARLAAARGERPALGARPSARRARKPAQPRLAPAAPQPRIRAAKRQPESHANRNIVRATMSGPSAGIAPRPAPRAFAAPPDRPKTCLP
ncbi:conserved hypothetical protein [Burkholderia pseudomallei MSHR346]|nr:conserved hypothetical protein [Burkholderia pseudomallei MSHR346]